MCLIFFRTAAGVSACWNSCQSEAASSFATKRYLSTQMLSINAR
jgi:hypothetical protein